MFFKALNRRDEYPTAEDGSYLRYEKYRDEIAVDCLNRCGYCDRHENALGGPDAMQLDHFRPWNKSFGAEKEKKFQHLKNEPTNLVHACRPCNGYKWAHWPTEDPAIEIDDRVGWVSPFRADRSEFFSVGVDGELSAAKPSAQYQIKILRLNRPLLKRQRELRQIVNGWQNQGKAQVQMTFEGEADPQKIKQVQLMISLIDRLIDVFAQND